jgi:hypothetical protein
VGLEEEDGVDGEAESVVDDVGVGELRACFYRDEEEL